MGVADFPCPLVRHRGRCSDFRNNQNRELTFKSRYTEVSEPGFGRVSFRKPVPVQLVDATPSELEALCKGGVYVDQRQAKRAFCGAESRVVEPLEDGPVEISGSGGMSATMPFRKREMIRGRSCAA